MKTFQVHCQKNYIFLRFRAIKGCGEHRLQNAGHFRKLIMVAEMHTGKNSTWVGGEKTNEEQKQGLGPMKITAATAIFFKLIVLSP